MNILIAEINLDGGAEHKLSQLTNQGKADWDEGNHENVQKKCSVYSSEQLHKVAYSAVDSLSCSIIRRHFGSASSEEAAGLQLEPFVSVAPTASSDYWQFGVHTVTQSSPSPSVSGVDSVPLVSEVLRIRSADSSSSCAHLAEREVLKDVHLPARLMEDFLELARDNTEKTLETCGLLAAFTDEGTFYVTTLIIPKQESTSSSCQALKEEEIFAIQNEKSLFPVGWIHTHPTQNCFMSSVDLHTQYSYQVMVPEAIAIVMAPTDKSRGYGIFRLSNPSGMSILKECQESGFHPHGEPADGGSIYEHCNNVYLNPNLRLEICDLR